MKAWGAAALSIPLLGASSLLAHALAYRLVIPDPVERAAYYEDTGHAYLDYAPFFLGVAAALLIVGMLARAAQGTAGRRRLPAWPFALLPFLVFAIQEHTERAIHTGDFPADLVLGPTFILGFLLQLPCGLVAYAVARYLLRLADGLGQLLAQGLPQIELWPLALLEPSSFQPARPRIQALARCAAGRAPPLRRS
jgi:hypothetical protein